MPELRTDIEIIVADVSVEASLAAMCQQGTVILNCVGPVSTLSILCQRLIKSKRRGDLHPQNCGLVLRWVILCALSPLSVQVLWRASGQSLHSKWISLPGHLRRAAGGSLISVAM